MKNITFLLTHIPNPRMNKRITAARDCGNVSVVCVRRKSQNIWNPAFSDVEHIIIDIDLPSIKQLIKRYIISKRYQKVAFSHLAKLKPDIIYTEGLDSLMIANKYKTLNPDTHIFFEVADLRECFIEKPKSMLGRLSAKLLQDSEAKNLKNVDYIAVTSMKFYDYHYNKHIGTEKVLYLPNMPDTTLFKDYTHKTDGKFTIGFIGGIRYIKQMKMLIDAAGTAGCNVVFAGASVSPDDYHEITEYCAGKDYVKFTGKYSYNEEIAELYSMVDCVYAVYDADNPNVRIALPNKLYEAVYCMLPIIVAKGTYLAEIVDEWGVGVSVSHTDTGELAEALKRLSGDRNYYTDIVNKCGLRKKDINTDIYNKLLKSKILKILEI